MASQRRILRTDGPVALVEERIFVFEPALTIHVCYSITGGHDPADPSFGSLSAAQKYFAAEVARRLSLRAGSGDFRI